jgi:O-antigen ligase
LSTPLLNRANAHPAPARQVRTLKIGVPARSSGQAYLLGAWILMAVMTPLFGFLGARGFAPGVAVVGLLCLPLARPKGADVAGLILFGLLVEWAAISALWSPWPFPRAMKDVGRFTGLHLAQQVVFAGALVVTARVLEPQTARRALTWMGAGLMALAAVLLAEGVTGAALFQSVQPLVKASVRPDMAMRSVNQGGYVLAVLFWPTLIGFYDSGRTILAQALALGTGVTLVLLHVSAPPLALLTSIGVFAVVYWGRRWAVRGAAALAVALTVLTPWLMRSLAEDGIFHSIRPRLPPSWAARIDIWTFTAARMSEKPLFGWGLDASRAFKGHIPLHPHDAPLQLWFELGVPGVVLGALVWSFVFGQFAKAADRSRLFAAAGCATASVCFIIGAFSFSLWQEWWFCLCALAFACCILLGRQLQGAAGDSGAR